VVEEEAELSADVPAPSAWAGPIPPAIAVPIPRATASDAAKPMRFDVLCRPAAMSFVPPREAPARPGDLGERQPIGVHAVACGFVAHLATHPQGK
jgi:hypothetical protein